MSLSRSLIRYTDTHRQKALLSSLLMSNINASMLFRTQREKISLKQSYFFSTPSGWVNIVYAN